MARSLTASDRERRAIAGDVHDGPVQDLAGVSYALAALRPSVPEERRATEVAAFRQQQEVRRIDPAMAALRREVFDAADGEIDRLRRDVSGETADQLEAMVEPGSKSEVMRLALPTTKVTAMVSPSARPSPSMIAPMIETPACGKSTWRTTSQVVQRMP